MAEGYLRVVMPIAQDDLFQGMLSTFKLPKEELTNFRKAYREGAVYEFKDNTSLTGHTGIRLSTVPWYRIY